MEAWPCCSICRWCPLTLLPPEGRRGGHPSWTTGRLWMWRRSDQRSGMYFPWYCLMYLNMSLLIILFVNYYLCLLLPFWCFQTKINELYILVCSLFFVEQSNSLPSYVVSLIFVPCILSRAQSLICLYLPSPSLWSLCFNGSNSHRGSLPWPISVTHSRNIKLWWTIWR